MFLYNNKIHFLTTYIILFAVSSAQISVSSKLCSIVMSGKNLHQANIFTRSTYRQGYASLLINKQRPSKPPQTVP